VFLSLSAFGRQMIFCNDRNINIALDEESFAIGKTWVMFHRYKVVGRLDSIEKKEGIIIFKKKKNKTEITLKMPSKMIGKKSDKFFAQFVAITPGHSEEDFEEVECYSKVR
jgi:hypothetical protein